MEQKRVLICDPIDSEGIEKLEHAGIKVDVDTTITPSRLIHVVPNYDALVVRSQTKVTREVLEAGIKLKAIGRAGVGLDNIDVNTAQQRAIHVLNTPEAPAYAVAELTIGLILSLARNIPLADKTMKEGRWVKKELIGWQLRGKTLGLLGLGNIGEKVARIAKGFGMNILIMKRTPPPTPLQQELKAEYIPPTKQATFLQKSDIITIHVPLTPQTHKMIGKKEIDLMKDGAILINTSRGGIVDEQALLEALQSGKLQGAALDVYEIEPPTDFNLIRLPNAVCTPHIGGQTQEGRQAISTILAEKLIKTLKEV
jgi:D-3-phosphoglycerate dehydrogenase